MTTEPTAVVIGGTLPSWKCHKVVKAARIRMIYDAEMPGYQVLQLEAPTPMHVIMSNEWVAKHKPRASGYFVEYEDGYQSFSPDFAFETGYTKL
jgi:hypothetical protein